MLYSSLRYDILFLSFFRLGGYSVHVTSPPLWEGRVGLAPYMFPPPFRSNSSVITRLLVFPHFRHVTLPSSWSLHIIVLQ